jgi:hypothetical protein
MNANSIIHVVTRDRCTSSSLAAGAVLVDLRAVSARTESGFPWEAEWRSLREAIRL